jgi:hypothetical protein
MKLLYPYSNVMGLMFPLGKLENGGTCEFMTEKCYEECCSCNLDTEMGIEAKVRRNIFNFFLDNCPENVAVKMIGELKRAQCKIFTWFASGDCPSFLTEKFYAVVKGLDDAGIIQTGFTRNKNLWEKCHGLSKNNKTLLSIEDPENASEPGLYSIPRYEIGAIDIVHVEFGKKYVRSGCGGGYYEDHIKVHGKDTSHLKLDCKACYKNKTGCFATKSNKQEAQ